MYEQQVASTLDLPKSAVRGAAPLHIVIPVFNEGANFAELWAGLKSRVAEFETLVVYDFDEDDTVPVVQALIKGGEQRLRLLRNSRARGVASALRSAFDEVREGPVLVFMGDLSDDPSQIEPMLKLYYQGYSLVAASRYARGGKQIGGFWLKKALSRWAGLSLHCLRGIPTMDVTNAFKLYDARMLRDLQIESSHGYEINLEIVVKAFLRGYRIAELPTVWRDRTAGRSQFRLWAWIPHYWRWYFYAFCHRVLHDARKVGN